MTPEHAIQLRDRLAVAHAVAGSKDWAPSFTKDKEQFKKLLEAQARLDRKLQAYFRDLAGSRVLAWVDWVKYKQALATVQAAAKPNFNAIVKLSEDQVKEEVNIVTKVVFEEIRSAVTAGALSQITDSKIPVDNLSVLVDRVARDRAADLATQMTEKTVDRVRSSIETSLKLGEDTDTTTERLSKFIKDPAKAEQVAKTESGNAWRRGVIETGKQTGATTKTWQVEGDPCPICKSMSGQTVGINEDFVDMNGETYSGEDGAHPNDRCNLVIGYKKPEN